MDYIEIKLTCNPAYIEILIAEFSEAGFNSFIEYETGFDAYIEEYQLSLEQVVNLEKKYSSIGNVNYQLNKIRKKNWNEEWEKNYDPIIVSDQCIVKASFHKIEKSYPVEIIINPKMSFGTGHHATTFLMLSHQLEIDFNGKNVLDAGCGTGILGIMASMSGANHVDCCDIDEWSVENCTENISLNPCGKINVYHGTINSVINKVPYEIILANINKNVLLEEIPSYSDLQANEGVLILSGFYEEDVREIEALCIQDRYVMVKHLQKERWACIQFKKLKSDS